MKKIIFLMFTLAVVLFAISVPGNAHGGGYYGHGGGYYGHGGGYYGHGGGYWSGSIWIGPGWWGPWGYPYPYYSYPYYPYPYSYASPPAVNQQPIYQEQYPQQEEEQYYWYFCRESKTYYPYVKQCPGGWVKVVPKPQAP